jgi:hypothetical protein
MSLRTARLLFVLLGASALGAALLPGPEAAARPDPAAPPTVEQLIARLDSEDFAAREAAARALLERDDAEPGLKRAAQSASPEVRRRARQLLEERAERAYLRRLGPVHDLIRRGEVDLLPERMALAEDDLDDRVWEALIDLAGRLVAKANREQRMTIPVPDVNRLRGKQPPNTHDKLDDYHQVGHQRLVVPEVVKRTSISDCVIISRGRIQAKTDFSRNIVIANGDLDLKEYGPSGCVVICDGSVNADRIDYSLVIATGKVTRRDAGFSWVIENATEALGLVKFFDPRRVGVEAADADGTVVVKQAPPDKAFGRAGVRAGDRVVAIDGTKIADAPTFRRRVRSAFVTQKEITLTVQRPDQGSLDLKLRVTE